MTPLWKIRREFQRISQQLRSIPEAFWEPLAQRRHDAAFAAGFPQTPGALPAGEKMAVLLCWQPAGLAESTLETCRHLISAGYTPFVVSNAPVSAVDKARLAPLTWRLLERPNFGYDFGGYRDAIRTLEAEKIRPERLVILNDSVWFPLWPGDQTLQRMEQSEADVAGTVLRNRDGSLFLESYFFSLPRRTLEHPAFRSFWQGLRLTSNKYKVIRRGERGFGAHLTAAGLRLEGLFTPEDFLAGAAQSDDATLRKVLSYSAFVDADFASHAQSLAQSPASDGWRGSVLDFLRKALVKHQFYSSFPFGAVEFTGYPVLKKSSEPVSAFWRRSFLRAVNEGHLAQPQPEVFQEALTLTELRTTARSDQ